MLLQIFDPDQRFVRILRLVGCDQTVLPQIDCLGVDVRIADSGEVQVKSAGVLKGYYKNTMRIGDETWIGQQSFLHSAGGLDIGALTYVQNRLIAARDAGAAVLLISEDLDEILALSDIVHVMSEGRLSPEFPRGSKTPAELGVWMAGQGFDHAA